ncbi:hypothetical protein [uncultured Nostoc sp.]|uniref:hypothetical protein n=1 Tax=uncultured Nostoc sp. TaxID=340711 RepID=UPI0035CC1657
MISKSKHGEIAPQLCLRIDDWLETVVNQGFEALPDYKTPIINHEILPNPLKRIILPAKMDRKDINYIFLIKQNYVLLRTVVYYDGSKIAQYLSRIVYEHLQRNWELLYAPQVAGETSNNWLKRDK